MSAGGHKVFLDSNLLVNAYDRSEPQKQARARAVLSALAHTQAGVVSPQVLAEFFVTVTCKLREPLSLADALEQLACQVQLWTVVESTGFLVLEAARAVRKYRLNFWDAQIWAAARLNKLSLILSEDFGPDAVLEGVRFVNPFAADFRLERWR
jgi:predicted nucleic acid-binding protein